MQTQMRYTIGIDEVGRGPLAGPVVVAAVATTKLKVSSLKFKVPLRDSKKLSARQREKWFEWIKLTNNQRQTTNNGYKLLYATASVYPRVIDRINISRAANLAATRALARLLGSRVKGMGSRVTVLLDGGLYLNEKSLLASGYTLYPRTIARGDEKYNCVKLASIVAKVKRDRLMRRYHKKFPQYGFNQHKGYGTGAHIAAIRRYGICPLHRLTFTGKFHNIKF
ncbi:MAG: hypothetical protein A2745_03660 [Candidatus Harrisonbacteria bacterium RIFCSPHIGHO2_01_FULL_44_13]|uniref:Ribonuclease n=1 Tax=Candidatus Harrisonbacteria bacterium RIFCSPLOWO2_01_FULL_44_18 TaxID=1798407 RepID=A0A1G1ZL30_9BACT|nr:MAG: hypothetical protein A2745_03660 [Candidatus Harrisonbacteria bacterium RIFCSPHIGHO2_01_FULL_44_13]OGY65215.1 MAG: hypothetical protein A3A16_00800 [Candidatus Harrisonbacteria bacterium RIFCSPLOWO2_01_FULL_44_18]